MKSGVNHISILIEVSRTSFFLLLPFWFYHEGSAILAGTEENHLPADQVRIQAVFFAQSCIDMLACILACLH